jgi:pimeloyl-ACP methyl ester carboxylesterase
LAADPARDHAAYRRLFSAAALGEPGRLGPSLAAGWRLHYRGLLPHAAFAMARLPDGRSVWRSSNAQESPAAAEAAAMEGCRASAARVFAPDPPPCRLVAVDGAPRLAPGLPELAPREDGIGPFRAPPFLFRHGPGAAEGVILWGHGYQGPGRDLRDTPLPPLLALMNDAGWDVLRFDRSPEADSTAESLGTLLRGLPELRAAGYRRVVLGGQSRGGWQAMLAAAQRPELVDAVLAAAPAAHGQASRPNSLAAALEDFSRALAGFPPDRVRLLVLLFEEDAFDPAPAERAEAVAALAARRSVPTLAIWPQGRAAPRGHDGVHDWRLARDQGACVVALLQAPAAAAPRGLRRVACGGG